MLSTDLSTVELMPTQEGVEVAFPLHSAIGAADSALVWINLQPGAELAEHRDSAEETLLVVEGQVEATVDGETGRLAERQIALVPAMAPHSMRNVGDGPARVLGFFSSSTNIATFSEPMGPDGLQLFVIGAPQYLAVSLEQAAAV